MHMSRQYFVQLGPNLIRQRCVTLLICKVHRIQIYTFSLFNYLILVPQMLWRWIDDQWWDQHRDYETKNIGQKGSDWHQEWIHIIMMVYCKQWFLVIIIDRDLWCCHIVPTYNPWSYFQLHTQSCPSCFIEAPFHTYRSTLSYL